MKRLVFCFDGTWNTLNEFTPTNVVLTAASIQRTASDGVTQIIHYDEGVGTGGTEHLTGGMFGAGLVEHVRDAYRFLIFNYDAGDELYVFGFSRGAFSARSFIGFLRHIGPLRRLHAGRIDQALELYRHRIDETNGAEEELRQFRADYSGDVCIGKSDDAWRCANVPTYTAGAAPVMTIRYLGVWDTVSALGVPANLPFSMQLNREHRFHDAALDDFVENARHAVALDERRATFPSVPLGPVTDLNRARGHNDADSMAPYQERWFPGVHGSVGGGGDIRGLSDDALAWVLKGAKAAGLHLDTAHGTRIDGFHPDWTAPLVNLRHPTWSPTQIVKSDRAGPDHAWQMSTSAIRRWQTPPSRLPEAAPYRPKSLSKVEGELSAMPPWTFTAPADLIDTVFVRRGDTLGAYAAKYYGDVKLYPAIFAANEDVLENPDDLFEGQSIRIPRLAPAPSAIDASRRNERVQPEGPSSAPSLDEKV